MFVNTGMIRHIMNWIKIDHVARYLSSHYIHCAIDAPGVRSGP